MRFNAKDVKLVVDGVEIKGITSIEDTANESNDGEVRYRFNLNISNEHIARIREMTDKFHAQIAAATMVGGIVQNQLVGVNQAGLGINFWENVTRLDGLTVMSVWETGSADKYLTKLSNGKFCVALFDTGVLRFVNLLMTDTEMRSYGWGQYFMFPPLWQAATATVRIEPTATASSTCTCTTRAMSAMGCPSVRGEPCPQRKMHDE